jgi:nucleoside-diphosphate-sugar epimerase
LRKLKNGIFVHLADPKTNDFDANRAKSIERELFDIASLMGPKFIYVSSALVYCRSGSLPKKISDRRCSIDSYTDLKIHRENVVLRSNGRVLRLGNLYGKGMKLDNVIGKILISLTNRQHFKSEFNPTRDFVHVNDVINSLISIQPSDLEKGGVTNIGSGIGIPISNIYDSCVTFLKSQNIFNFELPNVHFPDPKSSDDQITLNINQFNTFPWWQPKYSFIDEIYTVFEDMLGRITK